jgi:hypothetical protein
VLSQQLQGQLQTQHSADTGNYIMDKHNIIIIITTTTTTSIIIIIIIQFVWFPRSYFAQFHNFVHLLLTGENQAVYLQFLKCNSLDCAPIELWHHANPYVVINVWWTIGTEKVKIRKGSLFVPFHWQIISLKQKSGFPNWILQEGTSVCCDYDLKYIKLSKRLAQQ